MNYADVDLSVCNNTDPQEDHSKLFRQYQNLLIN